MNEKQTDIVTLKSESNQNNFDATIMAFEKVKVLAEYLSTSDAFTKGFEQKDKDKNVMLDEITGKPKINVADVTIALMVGRSLGLDPASSLVIGSKLNQRTFLSIMKGRELGIGMTTAMEKIYNIETTRGIVSYTGVDVITAKLIQGGVSFLPLVKSYAPYFEYFNQTGKIELDMDSILDDTDNLKEPYFLYEEGVSAEALKSKMAEGKIIVTRKRHGYYSKVIMKRTMPNGEVLTIKKRFSTVDAERAELIPIYDSQGQPNCKGKDNWIKATPQMMDNRVITIAGRIIGADLLGGLYSNYEVMEIQGVNANEISGNSTD